MNNSIATEVIEEMHDLPDELQQQVLRFVVNLRQQYQQYQQISGDRVNSDTPVNLNKFPFDVDATPIWELVAKISDQAPDEEWQKLPTDLARRFDHYQKQNPGQN
jgi:thioester reductase-like protein